MSSQIDYEINKELGECYLQMGDLDKAREYYGKAIDDSHAAPYMGLATIAFQQADLDTALEMYSHAAAIDKGDKPIAGMGLVEVQQGKNAEAFAHFSAALELNPHNIIAALMIVKLGHALDRVAEVVPFLENFLSVEPNNEDVRYSLAGCLSCLERQNDAKAELETLLAANPEHTAAQELLAQL